MYQVQIQREVISDLKSENQFLSKEIIGSIRLTSSERCALCFKQIWKVGKVGREGLIIIMPTWNQL